MCELSIIVMCDVKNEKEFQNTGGIHCISYDELYYQFKGWDESECHCRRWNCKLWGGYGERNRRCLIWQHQLRNEEFFIPINVHLHKFFLTNDLTRIVNSIISAIKKATGSYKVIVFPGFKNSCIHLHIAILGVLSVDFDKVISEIMSARRIIAELCPDLEIEEGKDEYKHHLSGWLNYTCKGNPEFENSELPPPGFRFKQVYGLKIPIKKIVRKTKKEAQGHFVLNTVRVPVEEPLPPEEPLLPEEPLPEPLEPCQAAPRGIRGGFVPCTFPANPQNTGQKFISCDSIRLANTLDHPKMARPPP